MKFAGSGRMLLVFAGAAVCCLSPGAAESPRMAERVSTLVKQLDSQNFVTRQQADQELRGFGVAVVPLLKKEMEKRPPLEVHRRLENIVTDLSTIPWKTSFPEAQAEARRTGKPILVFSTIGDIDGFA